MKIAFLSKIRISIIPQMGNWLGLTDKVFEWKIQAGYKQLEFGPRTSLDSPQVCMLLTHLVQLAVLSRSSSETISHGSCLAHVTVE